MFDKWKRKIAAKAGSEAVNEIKKSSNEGRIRTISTILEGVIFVGLVLLSAKGGGKAAQTGITIIFNNCSIITK